MTAITIIVSIICVTALLAYIAKLIYNIKMTYIDEPVEKGQYRNNANQVISLWVRYKRTYKNGTVTYIEKEF